MEWYYCFVVELDYRYIATFAGPRFRKAITEFGNRDFTDTCVFTYFHNCFAVSTMDCNCGGCEYNMLKETCRSTHTQLKAFMEKMIFCAREVCDWRCLHYRLFKQVTIPFYQSKFFIIRSAELHSVLSVNTVWIQSIDGDVFISRSSIFWPWYLQRVIISTTISCPCLRCCPRSYN